MKRVTTRVIYTPRTVPPVEPTFKAVLIDNEKFVLKNYKAYTYAPADFGGDGDPIQLHGNFNTDIANLTVTTKTTSTSDPITIFSPEVDNPGIYQDGLSLMMYEWALGTLLGEYTAEVAPGGTIVPSGEVTHHEEKTYYAVTGIYTGDSTTEPATTAPSGREIVMAPLTYDEVTGWGVSTDLMPVGSYDTVLFFEDTYGISGTMPPVSVYLTASGDFLESDRENTLIEITNYSDIVDLYGSAAVAEEGNIAYTAALFYAWMGGVKTFYIAPMSSEGDIAELIEEMAIQDDAYFIIYNRGTYTEDLVEIGALKSHVSVMSGPLYKRERRLYCKESMVGTTAAAVETERQTIINAALALDDHRTTLVVDIADTNSFIKYCGYRYRVPVNYCLTNQRMAIGNVWTQVSKITETDKEEMKENGVVMFEQRNPMANPYVMYQTTTYIEQDVLAKKEEDIQISIDEVCRVIRQVLEPRIARGYDNKVTSDPLHPITVAYVANLNADISAVRTEYVKNREIFGEIRVLGVEINEDDPRQTKLLLRLTPYYNVNRIDIYIYI